ncbi:MAG: transcription termination factor NusA [Deltaproteobacteria bacterium]|nr:transcription termination factor NusA [Deltaproteobacteria bacterium]
MTSAVNMNLILDQVAKEKGVERGVLVETLEQAIETAALKTFGLERAIEAQYNEEKGVVEVFQALTVVAEVTDPINQITIEEAQEKGIEAEDGDELLFQIFYREEDSAEAEMQDERYGDILKIQTHRRAFGRIAAQAAKQVIIQRVRDAERENVFHDFKEFKGQIITGVVRRFERGNLVVELDKGVGNQAEAVLPVREQVPRESYRAGDRIQAYVLDVLREAKGPQIILSRGSEQLLVKLFEMEVPEIYEGIVEIARAAREPGGRAKIAVASRDPQVDPVGACVGMKGSRVQAVVQELRGEKIDIVPFDDDPARFVCAALAPAEVTRVLIDEANKAMEIIVPDDQLSLAIGRKGQNVRLAAKLTGWKLDINSESRAEEMRDFADESLGAIPGIDADLIEVLYAHGFRRSSDIADANAEVLEQIPGVDAQQVETMQEAARSQAVLDAEREAVLEKEREEARQAELRRHPDTLSPQERLLRVRGVGERTIEQLSTGGYNTVEDLHKEDDPIKLGESTGIGLKKARQIKTAVANYLAEEARLRTELDADGAGPAAKSAPGAESEHADAALAQAAETDGSESNETSAKA